tara:strand:- start:146 stop:3154 length:3009 start_codon:yes stop_codon:yes gene_type:complete
MTNSYKKEYPLVGFPGFGGGAGALSYKSGSTKVYVDEVFSTYLWKGTGSDQTINTGLDMSGEGGMVWVKNRSSSVNHAIVDTVRGAGKYIESNTTDAEDTYSITDPNARNINSFTSTGFTLKSDDGNQYFNWPTGDPKYTSWSFRKAKGFFDVVTYTGTGSARTVNHNLGSIPGMIIVKRLDTSDNWNVYHRGQHSSNPPGYYLQLNTSDSIGGASNRWNDTAPTATEFTLGTAPVVNANGDEFIAYLFAGGESTADTARSVDFDGNDYLSMPVNNSDFDWAADGSLTIEAWVYMDNITGQTYNSIINRWNGSGKYSFGLDIKSNGNLFFYRGNGSTITTHESSRVTINVGQWYHIAVVKDGTTGRFFINGQACGTFSWNEAFTNSTSIPLHIGNLSDGNSYPIDGKISNARFVNGTALYTSSFKPTYEPLTNITNTKLLCCNNSSVTGATVPSSETFSINVGNSGSSAYTLSGTDRNGSVSGNNATVTINTGDTVNFAVNASGHPFYIRVSNGGSNVSTPAATGQGSQSGTVSWTPNTAGTFYYQCGFHSGMIGTITVQDAITANGDPTASTDSPFDDPEGFKFGSDADENIIKTSSYIGNGATNGPEVYVGFEPQWLLIKNATGSNREWKMLDVIRGVPVGTGDVTFNADTDEAENTGQDVVDVNPTGFKITNNNAHYNENGERMIYIAIRRPDGYVGKPAEAGTDVFAMDYGNASSTSDIATYDSGFPVGFSIRRQPATSQSWYASSRLTATKSVTTDTSDAEVNDSNLTWDRNAGVGKWSGDLSSYLMWMWKRHAGFDVVCYEGNSDSVRIVQHRGLGAAPDMIWIKNRDDTTNWIVGHKDLDGGNEPWTHYLVLNSNDGEGDYDYFVDKAPTEFSFEVTTGAVNDTNKSYIALLFKSIDGISSVGTFTGNGSTGSSGPFVTTGFQPRFIMVKRTDSSGYGYNVNDSVRGMDKRLAFNIPNAEIDRDAFTLSSTGFRVKTDNTSYNANGGTYVYYAHA